MPFRRSRWLLALALLVMLPAGCSSGGGIEGKYYNSAGEYALELKGGKVTFMQGQEGRAATYEVRGDSLVIHDPRGLADQMTFGIEKDGTLSLGILGSLTKRK
jgi:hypothetical protein